MGNDAIKSETTSQPDAQKAKLVDAADLDSRTVQSTDPSEGVVHDEVPHDARDFTKTEVDDAALDARLQDMPLTTLQENIVSRWGHAEKDLGPYFYHARLKMGAQGVRNDILRAEGKPEEGFSAWCDQHDIPRSTANLWADRYAVRIGAKPKPKPGPSTASGAQPPTEESTSSNVGQGPARDAGDSSTAIGAQEPAVRPEEYPDPFKVSTNRGERKRYDHAIRRLAVLMGLDSDKEIILAALLADLSDEEWHEFENGVREIAASSQTTRYKDTILEMLRAALREVRRGRIAA
jgi:hypothetical protein